MLSPKQVEILKEKLTDYFKANPDEFMRFLTSGQSIRDFLREKGEKLIKFLLPDTFLVTIELSAPKDSTITEAIIMLDNHLPGAKVVHIEKMEIKG